MRKRRLQDQKQITDDELKKISKIDAGEENKNGQQTTKTILEKDFYSSRTRSKRSLYLFNQTRIKVNWRPQSVMSIIKIISINQYTLAVYYTSADCYKYSIIDDDGTIYEPDDIFYTSEAAEREGREAINAVSN